jgi:hypothetical protein
MVSHQDQVALPDQRLEGGIAGLAGSFLYTRTRATTTIDGYPLNHKRHAKSLTFTATERLGIRCIGLKLMIDMDRPDSAGTAMAVGCQVQ